MPCTLLPACMLACCRSLSMSCLVLSSHSLFCAPAAVMRASQGHSSSPKKRAALSGDELHCRTLSKTGCGMALWYQFWQNFEDSSACTHPSSMHLYVKQSDLYLRGTSIQKQKDVRGCDRRTSPHSISYIFEVQRAHALVLFPLLSVLRWNIVRSCRPLILLARVKWQFACQLQADSTAGSANKVRRADLLRRTGIPGVSRQQNM